MAGTQMTQEVVEALCNLVLEEMERHQDGNTRLTHKLERLQKKCSHPRSYLATDCTLCAVCGKELKPSLKKTDETMEITFSKEDLVLALKAAKFLSMWVKEEQSIPELDVLIGFLDGHLARFGEDE